MIVDKAAWVQHGGMPIFSIEIDHEGKRVVTAGAEGKVRVWALAPILHQRAELDPAMHKALATLSEHLSSVNCARFSPKGHFIASGDDDGMVLLHQLMPGQAKAPFGSKDPPNVENWRQVQNMRGHSSNVSDIAWCPDGTKLASSCIDNNVIVWDAATGRQIATLAGHHGHVKGVAWDPFDHYLASQGEQDGVCIWSTLDWSLVTRVQKPWENAGASHSFNARPHWSPDGQMLVATNAYQKPIHQAPLIRRGNWAALDQLCGHKAAVGVAKCNPHMFYKKAGSDEASVVCALGSADRQFTIWNISESRPVAICDKFFKGGVLDLAWTPDGHGLLASSYDGTIAVVVLSDEELGVRLPESDMAELVHDLYGDQQKHGQALLADPQLLLLEMDTDQAMASPAAAPAPLRPPTAPAARPAPAAAAAGGAAAAAQRLGAAGGALRPGAAAGLDSRLGAGGATLGGGDVRAAGSGGAAAAPTRKRLTPTPVGGDGGAAGPSGPGTAPAVGRAAPVAVAGTTGGAAAAATGTGGTAGGRALGPDGAPAPKRIAPQPVMQGRLAAAVGAGAARVAPAPAASGAAAAQPPAVTAAEHTTTQLLPPPPIRNSLSVSLGLRQIANTTHPSQQETVLVEAYNNIRNAPSGTQARIQCTAGGRVQWFDMVQASVVQLSGTFNFTAASLSNGDLLVLSAAGRRLCPSMCLGGPAVLMAHDNAWQLLVLTMDGRIRSWDLRAGVCTLDVSLAPVLTSWQAEVTDVRISSAGAPVVILANHHAYTYLQGMQLWGRVADDSFPSSQFHTSFAANQGDLGRVQAEAAAARRPRDVVGALQQPADVQRRAVRAHLESNVAAALALQSPQEWKRWLLTYVRQLAGDEDVPRLREVVLDLLGPVRWTPTTHASHEDGSWTPTVLGFYKRTLLRSEVIREIARPRTAAMQELAQQCLDLMAQAEEHCPAAQQQQQQTLTGSTTHNQQQQQPAAVGKVANGGFALDPAHGRVEQEDLGRQGQGHVGGATQGGRGGVTGVMPPGAAAGGGGGGGGMSWLQTGS